MKFAALALTLLLAVGSYGDGTNEWPGDRIKEALPEAQKVADRIADSLLDTEYADRVPEIKEKVEIVMGSIRGVLDTDELKGFYQSAKSHSEEIARRWDASLLRSTAINRLELYRTIFDNFIVNNRAAFEDLKIQLMTAISQNHEETIGVLSDAANVVSQDIRGYVEKLRSLVEPYITEYKDHLNTAMEGAKASTLRATLEPKVKEIGTKMGEIYSAILAEMNKN